MVSPSALVITAPPKKDFLAVYFCFWTWVYKARDKAKGQGQKVKARGLSSGQWFSEFP